MSRNCSCEFSDNPCSSCLIANRDELIATLQKNNDTLNTDLKEAEGAVADLMVVNDIFKAEVKSWQITSNRETDGRRKAEAERDRLTIGLTMLSVGSCMCGTKTNEPEHHKSYCHYKKIQTLLNHKEK